MLGINLCEPDAPTDRMFGISENLNLKDTTYGGRGGGHFGQKCTDDHTKKLRQGYFFLCGTWTWAGQ